jgi:hypothetical protein
MSRIPSSIRVAARHAAGARSRFSPGGNTFSCAKEVSTAWIDPNGKVYGLTPGEVHNDWSETWIEAHDPTRYAEIMQGLRAGDIREHWSPFIFELTSRGWVQVNSMRHMVLPKNPSAQAMAAAAELVANCLAERHMDPEVLKIVLFTSPDSARSLHMPSKTVTGADFVRGYGGRELEEDVFEYLLERHLARG